MSQDASSLQPQKTLKNKSKEVAAKLERFAHNPSQNTGKTVQLKISLSPSTTLKGLSSHSKPSKMASTPSTPTAARSYDLSALEVSTVEEPFLREVLMAVNGYKFALSEIIKWNVSRRKWHLSGIIYKKCVSAPKGWKAESVELRM